MAFQWERFCQSYRIEYVASGPNVARENINIRCPFCGTGDTSHHMGLSLVGEGWGCWRNNTHRGKDPKRLVMRLLGCTWEAAASIVGDPIGMPLPQEGSFADEVSAIMGPKQAPSVTSRESLLWPREMRPIEDRALGRIYVDYLVSRGYSLSEALSLIERYDLRYAFKGPFSYRLIIPVYMEQGLVNWTGRTVVDHTVRYRSLSADPEKAEKDGLPVAPMSIEQTLWNYKQLLKEGGKVLSVVEGPMDSLRVDYYGREYGIRSTCLFGTGNLSDEQVWLLESLVDRFERRVLVLDPDAAFVSIAMQQRLGFLGFEFQVLPGDVEDPAVMKKAEILQFFS